jgi:hypothetical protein
VPTASEIRVAVVNAHRREGSLYAVLQGQYRAKTGRPIAEDLARAEIFPFMHLPEQEALAAFIEYTVFKELRSEANVPTLEKAVRDGLRLTTPSEREILKAIDARGLMFQWGLLLQASSDIKATRLIQHIKWGIGKNEVAQMFSGKQSLPVEPGWNEIGFLSLSYGLPASFFFYFVKTGMFGSDKLTRVQIMYLTPADPWPSDEEIERAYQLVKEDLLAQYGSPSKILDTQTAPVEYRLSEMLVWKLPASLLTLACVLAPDGVLPNSCPPVTVGYGDRKHDPISLPWAND